MLIFLRDKPIGAEDGMATYIQVILYGAIFFGVFGTVRQIIAVARGRTALAIDQHGVTTTGLSIKGKNAKRKTRTTPWDKIDLIVLEHRRTSPNAMRSYLCLRTYSDDGNEVDVAPQHPMVGYTFSQNRIREATRHFAPSVQVKERHITHGV